MDAGANSGLFDVFSASTPDLFELERSMIDRAIEMAIVNEDCFQSLLAAIRTHDNEPIGLSWLRTKWAAFKAIRRGIGALSRVEKLHFATSEPGLITLRKQVLRAIDTGWAASLWWNVRVETARSMLDQWGLADSHADAVRRYTLWHKERADRQ